MPDERPLEIHFASPFSVGLGSASRLFKESFQKTFHECDAALLIRALLIVMDRKWDRANRNSDGPGAEKWAWSTRLHRPAIVREIMHVWCELAGCDAEDDVFPFHESYVIRMWVEVRKFGSDKKERLISAAKSK